MGDSTLRDGAATCSSCGRFGRGPQLPRGWKVCGPDVFCGSCRRQRFRLRFITMAVAAPIRVGWQDFRIALEAIWGRTARLLLTDDAWELTIIQQQHIARVFIGNQWWALRLHDANWSPGRSETYARIASGKTATGEFFLARRPTDEGCIRHCPSNGSRPYEVVCKTVAWLPREGQDDLVRPPRILRSRTSRPDPSVRNKNIVEIDISNLRGAIRANWVTFPSQVPTFPTCDQPDLQRKLVQLYFVMGWSCAQIAARYGLLQDRVRVDLVAWKRQAANAGYIQHIPSADVIGQLQPQKSSPHADYREQDSLAHDYSRPYDLLSRPSVGASVDAMASSE